MTREIVFARTRHHYDSYIDFWRLVEASGFPIVGIDEINCRDDSKTFIFTPINGEVMERFPEWAGNLGTRARIIWWNLERWDDETRELSMLRAAAAVDQVWCSDRTYAARDPRLTFVPVAGHRNFGSRFLERRYDICHLAYLWGRRKEAVDALIGNGIRVAPEAWGRAAQDETVAKSHLMLNMHQYEGMDVIAPIRFAVAASYAIPIVSEPFADVTSSHLVVAQAPLWQMPAVIGELLRDPDRLRIHGHRLFEELCMVTDFERVVRYEAGKS